MLLTFKSFQGLLPSYLTELLTQYTPNRANLRSGNDEFRLTIPRSKLTVGDKAFYAVVPKLWNSLPVSLRSCSTIQQFRKGLKFHLFPK